MYYDGDVYESDGTVTRKYGIANLGNLSWTYQAQNTRFVASISAKAKGAFNIFCAKYVTATSTEAADFGNKQIKGFSGSGIEHLISIHDESYTDEAEFKTSLSGVYAIYELETYTTETAEPYAPNQIVSDWGTEEYVSSTNIVPVGHETQYQPNLKAKLEMAPDSPSDNGDYFVRHTNGSNAYVSLETRLATKANIDGDYESMTVGNADQLVSSVYEEDSVPYIFRTSGGSIDIGDRETDKIVGGTVSWNQQVQNGDFSNGTTGWTGTRMTISAENNVLSAKVNEIITNGSGTRISQSVPIYQNHIYYLAVDYKPAHTHNLAYSINGGSSTDLFGSATQGVWNIFAKLGKPTSSTSSQNFLIYFACIAANGYSLNDIDYVRNVNCIDLTQMFGSIIADYIYSLETANAGAGVAWFKKLFPSPYYAYNTGELMHVSGLSAHKMVGFNAWDEEFGSNISIGSYTGNSGSVNYIPVVPSATYYFHTGTYSPNARGIRMAYYDANKNLLYQQVIYRNLVTMPNDCRYIKFGLQTAFYGSVYNHDICINLHWDGERDGEYEAYEKHSYALDSSLTLRGIPKLDASNNLYYDGDVYESDGTVTRKYAVVNLGDVQSWLTQSDGANHVFRCFVTFNSGTAKMPSPLSIPANAMMSNGYKLMAYSPITKNDDKSFALGNEKLVVVDHRFTDPADFKSAMSGVYLVYELATPTTESATGYTATQVVDDFGTEEYVITTQSDVVVPVGHETKYQANLKAKLEMMADSPSDNGDYVLRHNNGENSYVALTKELPTLPTEDGNFVLKCTVSSGTATLSWESET